MKGNKGVMLQPIQVILALAFLFTGASADGAGKKLKPGFIKPVYRVDDSRQREMEAGYCAPGMPCYENSMRAQNPLAMKVAIFGEDDRVSVRHGRGTPHAPIGAISNLSLGIDGTAFLIDQCYILTAGHIVTGINVDSAAGTKSKSPSSDQSKESSYKFVFAVGENPDGTFEATTTATVVHVGKMNPTSPDNREDFALLKISDCLGEKTRYGHFAVSSLSMESATKLKNRFRSAGFPFDRGQAGVTVSNGCAVRGRTAFDPTDEIWGVDCPALPGNSGGPLYVEVNGKLVVVAMMTGIYSKTHPRLSTYTPNKANFALSMKHIWPQILPYLETRPVASNK